MSSSSYILGVQSMGFGSGFIHHGLVHQVSFRIHLPSNCGNDKHLEGVVFLITEIVACVADETKPRYSPADNTEL